MGPPLCVLAPAPTGPTIANAMADTHPIGSLVALRDRKLAAQLARGEEVGVVLQRRRNDARVIYLSDRKAHWIDDARLWPVRSESPALQALAKLLEILRPEEAQIERSEGSLLEVHALCTEFSDATLELLRERLGSALNGWSVQPYGMAFFSVVVELRTDQ